MERSAELLPSPMLPGWGTVASSHRELDDTVTLVIEPPEGSLEFDPGQFTMLYHWGVGEIPISISGRPDQPDRLVQTIRAVGAVSSGLCDLAPGDRVGVRGPFGTSWPTTAAEGGDALFVAGGIGLAPLRPAIYRVLEHRDRYSDVVLLYGARSPDELLFTDELHEWGARFDMTVLITVDSGEADWTGSVGVVTNLIRRAPFDPEETFAMVCGPEVMMRFCAAELIREGVASSRVFVSMERNMKCAYGSCGHCQMGSYFVCHDGPVFALGPVSRFLTRAEL